MAAYDAIVVGAAVTGSAVARELSGGTAAFWWWSGPAMCARAPASKLRHCARRVRRGARHLESENERPGQPADGPDLGGAGRALLPVGAFVVCLREEELPRLEELYQRGLKNGVPDLNCSPGTRPRL